MGERRERAGDLPAEFPDAAHSHGDNGRDFVLLLDPGPDPLVEGMELPRLQVLYGLRYGGFNPGTVLWDPVHGLQHTVYRRGVRWDLDPPSPRIDRSGKKRKRQRGNRAR